MFSNIICKLMIYCCVVSLPALTGCRKAFLDKKPNTDIVVPTTISDMTALLDSRLGSDYVTGITFSSPALGIISGEEFYYPSIDIFNSIQTNTEKNCYMWSKDIYEGDINIADWNAPYSTIFTANVVLDGWKKLPNNERNSVDGENLKAWALFTRSFAFYNLVQIFSPAYDPRTANTDLGIPLKLSSDINKIEPRATVQQTYQQILTDLKTSIGLFAAAFPANHPNRGSKASAYALLARSYLVMGDFDDALIAADSSLSLHGSLMDYNTIDLNTTPYFTKFNKELIYVAGTVNKYTYVSSDGHGPCAIDKELISLYGEDDLRKEVYFRKEGDLFFLNAMYAGSTSGYPFTGLAVDEMYLIKAECLARINKIEEATQVLNRLLVKRYKQGTYKPLVAVSQAELLGEIFLERRKELIWRGIRWSDLKRRNVAGAGITLTRMIGGKTFTLPPNDPRYVMPIPEDEIAMSHIKQNQR